MTHDTREVEEVVEDFNRRYYNQEFSYPDGEFNFTFVTDHLRTTLHHQLQKAREEERAQTREILKSIRQIVEANNIEVDNYIAGQMPFVPSELDQDVSK